jgi:formate-dependent nitrite reductase cytochrome c552 subunit
LPVPWVKIHNEPDYAYFNHAVHVNRGISCVECHGQVNQMDTVSQVKPLGMAFCLDCHRDPEAHIRPVDKVTDLTWKADSPAAQIEQGTKYVHDWKVLPPQSCSGCHR